MPRWEDEGSGGEVGGGGEVVNFHLLLLLALLFLIAVSGLVLDEIVVPAGVDEGDEAFELWHGGLLLLFFLLGCEDRKGACLR